MTTAPQPIFAALADPMRRQLLEDLAENSPRTATHLAAGRPITRQGVLKHLNVLADAGYDSESNDRVARLDMGVRSLIKAGAGRPTSKPPTTPYRRRIHLCAHLCALQNRLLRICTGFVGAQFSVYLAEVRAAGGPQ